MESVWDFFFGGGVGDPKMCIIQKYETGDLYTNGILMASAILQFTPVFKLCLSKTSSTCACKE